MDQPVFMSGFFEELKRRKVYRVAIAYIVASWALAQGIAQVFPVFDIPNSRIRVVILLLLIGFPIALVLAWIFDITPSGIERTSTAQPVKAPARRRRNVALARNCRDSDFDRGGLLGSATGSCAQGG